MDSMPDNQPVLDSPPAAPALTWGDIALTIVLVAVGILGILIGFRLLADPAALEDASAVTVLGFTATALVYLVGLAAIALVGVRKVGWAGLGWRSVPAHVYAWLPVVLVGQLVGVGLINSLLAWLNADDFDNPQIDALTGGEPMALPQLVLILLLVAVLVPIVEELFFRGMLYGVLRRQAGAGITIVLSAALFAVAHAIPLLLPALFFIGLVLGVLRERTGSLLPCIVVHMLQNGFTILAINAVLAMD